MRFGDYESHAVCELFPIMPEPELDALARDIRAHGLQAPIILSNGRILDGRNRLLACLRAGVEPTFCEWNADGGSELSWIVSMNLHRRHLSAGQRALIAARLTESFAANARRRRGARTDLEGDGHEEAWGRSAAKAGELLDVSARTVEHARTLLRRGDPALIEAVRDGRMSVSAAAARAARASESVQRERGRDSVRANRRQDGERQASPVSFELIAAFPNWDHAREIAGLRRLEMRSIAASSATACVTASGRALPRALQLLSAWGFEYAGNYVCLAGRGEKSAFARERHLLLIVGTRGDLPPVPDEGQVPESVLPIGSDEDGLAATTDFLGRLFPIRRKLALVERASPIAGWEVRSAAGTGSVDLRADLRRTSRAVVVERGAPNG